VLLAAGDTDSVDTLGISACRNDVYSNGRNEARMITTAKLATGTGAVLA
jgi:hypothetical protein